MRPYKVHMHVMADPTNTPDPSDVTACTCFNLRKAARAVTLSYDAALRPAGIKATQFSILATLDKKGPLPMTRLAEDLLVDRTALSRNLKPLERDGLVRLASETDQRVRLVTLTADGQRVFARALPLWEARQAEIAGAMGRADWAALLTGLDAAVATTRDR
mgnify:CR=1 FL=1